MKRIRTILALGAFFVLAAGLSACGGGASLSGNVALMDGNPISKQAFNHWLFVAAKGQASSSPGAPVIVPNDPPNFNNCIRAVRAELPSLAKQNDKTLRSDCNQLFHSLSSQVMDFLIRAYWYQGLAHKLNIKITDAQVQKAFQSAKKQQFPTDAGFKTFLTQSGQTLTDIIFRVRVNQLYLKLLAHYQQPVTAARIAAYFKAHPTQFGTPATRDIRIVRTGTLAKAEAAKKALEHGQSWQKVAKQYSIDTQTKNNGGLLAGVTKGQEEQALDTAAFAAPANKLEGPVHGQFGYYVFVVEKIKAATTESLAKATPLIKQILSGQQQSSAQTAVDAVAKKMWLSQTSCASAYSMADCHGYTPPKTTPTPGVPPSTTPTSTVQSAPTTTVQSTPTATTGTSTGSSKKSKH